MLLCNKKRFSAENSVNIEVHGFRFEFLMIRLEQCPCKQLMVKLYESQIFKSSIGIDIQPFFNFFGVFR